MKRCFRLAEAHRAQLRRFFDLPALLESKIDVEASVRANTPSAPTPTAAFAGGDIEGVGEVINHRYLTRQIQEATRFPRRALRSSQFGP